MYDFITSVDKIIVLIFVCNIPAALQCIWSYSSQVSWFHENKIGWDLSHSCTASYPGRCSFQMNYFHCWFFSCCGYTDQMAFKFQHVTGCGYPEHASWRTLPTSEFLDPFMNFPPAYTVNSTELSLFQNFTHFHTLWLQTFNHR